MLVNILSNRVKQGDITYIIFISHNEIMTPKHMFFTLAVPKISGTIISSLKAEVRNCAHNDCFMLGICENTFSDTVIGPHK